MIFDKYCFPSEEKFNKGVIDKLGVLLKRNELNPLVDIIWMRDGGKPSEFMVDFQQSGSVFITGRKTTSDEKLIPCPRCKTGHMTVRKNERNNNYFVGCSNFPQCDYTIRDTSIMRDTRYCPQCGGFLIKRKGKWSTFYGCSNYPLCKYTDKNVENISNQTNH